MHAFGHRKIKLCVSKEQVTALCPGRIIDECSTISFADKFASAGNPEDAEDEDEDEEESSLQNL